MTAKKPESEKYGRVQVSYRPDQEAKVIRLQGMRKLSSIFQKALDECDQ